MMAHDGLLLIEDATINSSSPWSGGECYVLDEDLIARGLAATADPSWKKVNYDQFVQLTLEYDKVVSWL